MSLYINRTSAVRLPFELACPDIAAWRKGNTEAEGVWQFKADKLGRSVTICALVHGNELCGAWALLALLQAGVRPQQGKLTLAFCNLAAFDRFDASHHDASRFVDEDLNRQWLPERMDSAHTQERRRASELRPFIEQADWLLDLHSMHERAAPLLLTGVQPRNLQLAKALKTPQYIVVDAGHKEGVRMRDFGGFGLPDRESPNTRSLLLECGFHGDLSSRAVAQDMCVRFLIEAGALSSSGASLQLADWQLADAPQQWALQVTHAVVAKNEHFCFTEAFQGLEVIAKAGTVIGYQSTQAYDLNDLREAVYTPYDDCVLVMPSVRQAKSGVTVVRFATRQLLT